MILRRGGKNTQKNYTKNGLHDQDNHDGVITCLGPTSWNVKSSGPQKASLQTKLVEVIEFQLSYFKQLFQILIGDALKVLNSICQQMWKTQQWTQDWKRSVFIPIPNKGNSKECSNYGTIALISHANKVMLKILQARLQQYVNHELPDVQAAFRKGRGSRNQIANIHWIIKKAR